MAVAIAKTDNPASASFSPSFVGTYSSVSIGVATSDRVVAVTCTSRNIKPLSATIDYGSGDVAMSSTALATDLVFGTSARIFYLGVSSGTTATFKVTYDGDDFDGLFNHIIVYRVTGSSDTLNNSGIDISSSADTDPLTTGSITIPTSGGFLGGTGLTFGSVQAWSNATEDINTSGGSFNISNAIRVTSGTATITATGSESSAGGLAWVLFSSSSAINIPTVFFGAGNLSANTVSLNQQISARFVGAGSLRGALTGLNDQFGSATLGGIGSFRTDTILRRSIAARFVGGTGDLRANTLYGLAARVRFGGIGSLSADTLYFAAPLPPAPPELIAGEWPEERLLPQCPVLNGFSEQRQRNVVEFQADVGFTKLRRRATASVIQTSVTFRMTDAEVDTFNEWYVDYQEDGALEFTWDHPITKVNYSWMFDAQDAPRIERMTPGTFRVSFNLLRLD